MLTKLVDRVRAARATGQAGLSLTELIVAMGLTVVLGAVTLTLFITVNNSASATTDRTVGAGQARTVLQAWTSYLQVADGTITGSSNHRFEWITPTDMLFHADLGNRSGSGPASTPPLMWLRLDTKGQLVEERFANASSFPATASTCRILSLNATSLTLTGYTTGTGAGTNFGTASGGSGAGCIALAGVGTAGTNTTLTAVTSVSITFTITATDGTRPQQYTSLAIIPGLAGS